MAKIQKHNLHTVEVDREALDKKIKAHRRKVTALVLGILILIGIAVVAAYIYYQNKVYSDYEVLSSVERNDTSASEYAQFQGNLLRYTNDGAVYTDTAGNLIWNQTYEMDQPMIETRGNYVAIYELGGTQVYILDTVNLQGSLHTTMPIQKVSIAAQGTVAILMENEGTSYLQLYDKTGDQLAAGELHVQNSGYPLDLALSENGEKMAVSMLDIHGGTVKTVIAFYNFGSVGQNSIDKIVSSYKYESVVIPQIRYLAQDTMAAFGDDRVILFTGAQKPAESKVIELKDEVKSIFYNERQFGLVYDGEKGNKHRLELYTLSGEKSQELTFDTDYTKVEILENGELCIQGDESCEIYNAKGICKFKYEFKEYLYKVLSGKMQTDYTFILEGETQKVKLK